jgi:hypothetical protein
MIVFVIYLDRIRSLEFERDSPISTDSNRPSPRLPPFELVEIEAWEAHV